MHDREEDDGVDAEDGGHARFNATKVNFNEDLSPVPGPSGINTNISAIDRRSAVPEAAKGVNFSNITRMHSPRRHFPYPHSNSKREPPILEKQEANQSQSVSIRHRKDIREIHSRNRLSILPMPVDRSTSESDGGTPGYP
ncbi:hypothetical protein RP20_CCG025194 [Aedes albopictus]|nr:hypothetical protein RP20_CCG025194 [Aedes albopictus]